jgi:hypothetical protein
MGPDALMERPLADVRTILGGYADRGVFRGIDDGAAVGEAVQFTFTWHGGKPIRCVLAPPTLTLRDFLPAMPARSDIYQDLRDVVKQFADPALPEHRGVAPDRAVVRTTNRNQRLSLAIESRDGDYAYATRKLIFVAHEVWLRLQTDWVHYLWDEFGASME